MACSRESQSINAHFPIWVTENGSVICFNGEHFEKAYLPIDVTDGEINIDVNDMHSQKE